MITAGDVRAAALSLPRTEEHLIRDHVKFRIGRIVYVSISPEKNVTCSPARDSRYAAVRPLTLPPMTAICRPVTVRLAATCRRSGP